MTDLTPEALEARKTLTDAIGNGASDAVLVSSELDGPGLWTSGLKRAVFGAVSAAMVTGAVAGGQPIGQSLFEQIKGPQSEISHQVEQSSIEALADQVGPKLFSKGGIALEIGETSTEPNARFFTGLDTQDSLQEENRCYAVYQPALRDALGSEVRLENTMESFALAHCMTAGGQAGSEPNIAGEGDFGRMMTNLAAARLIEGNVLGEDGRDLSDSSSVRDAWFASQFSQETGEPTMTSVDGIAAWLVLRRADDTLDMYGQPESAAEFREQAYAAAEDGFRDFGALFPEMSSKFPGDALGQINEALKSVYNASSPETRLDRMDDFMLDPAGATESIQQQGIEAYLGGGSSATLLDKVNVINPFSVQTISLDQVNAINPFEISPEADLSFENGPRF